MAISLRVLFCKIFLVKGWREHWGQGCGTVCVYRVEYRHLICVFYFKKSDSCWAHLIIRYGVNSWFSCGCGPHNTVSYPPMQTFSNQDNPSTAQIMFLNLCLNPFSVIVLSPLTSFFPHFSVHLFCNGIPSSLWVIENSRGGFPVMWLFICSVHHSGTMLLG